MEHALIHTLKDSIKILPFLFIAFLIMEYFEHKLTNKNKKIIQKSGKFGPLFGGILGAFPQCGFSVLATNFYAARIISIGTLVAIYLSTSDEMLPILLSEGAPIDVIIKLIILKVIVGIIFGFIIDFIFRKKKDKKDHIHEICDEDHCDCDHGILKSSLKHTINIFIFILITTFLINIVMEYYGEEKLSNIFISNNILSSFIASLVGLIPNCASSVIITELYLSGIITLGSAMAGLLTGSGVAIMVLFKINHNIKENIKIVTIIYSIGVLCGIIIDLLGVVI